MTARIYPVVPPALPPERRRPCRDRIERLSVVERPPAAVAYLEARTLAEAYPAHLAAIQAGLADGLRGRRVPA